VEFVLCLVLTIVIPYLLCGINSAIIVTKLKTGQDIRTLGSGNAGLTNVLRTQGKVSALFVLIGDVFKGVLSVLIIRLCFFLIAGIDITYYNPESGESYLWIAYLCGISGALGAIFPVYFGFKGGKGILVTVSILITVEWLPALLLLGIFIVIVAITRYVSLGSVIAAACYPITICVLSLLRHDPGVWYNTLCTASIAFLLIFMHRSNIKRLLSHTEKKLGQKA
jgi:glycerol-3-phosphate acyltransferase PlsY